MNGVRRFGGFLPFAVRLRDWRFRALAGGIAFLGWTALSGAAEPTTESSSQRAPAVRLLDLADRAVNPFQATNRKAVVFVFVSNTCPIANRYAPEIGRLHKDFRERGVDFYLVHPDPDETPAAIERHTREYGFECAVLRDPRHELVRLAQARVTPEAAMFLPGGRLVYRGRIDNRYEDFGKARPTATQHDLRDALEAVLAGRPVPAPAARAVGCYIADLK